MINITVFIAYSNQNRDNSAPCNRANKAIFM